MPDIDDFHSFFDYEIKSSGFAENPDKFFHFQCLFILPMMYPKGNSDLLNYQWNDQNSDDEFDHDEDGEEFESEGYDDSDEWDDETETRESNKPSDPGNSEEEDDSDKKEGDTEGGGTDPEGESDDQIKSHTDETYRKNESKLFSVDASSYYYGNIPDIDLSKAIVSYKQLWSEYRTECIDFQERNRAYYDIKDGINTKKFQKIRNDAKKVVGYLAKEFELRKNADQ